MFIFISLFAFVFLYDLPTVFCVVVLLYILNPDVVVCEFLVGIALNLFDWEGPFVSCTFALMLEDVIVLMLSWSSTIFLITFKVISFIP